MRFYVKCKCGNLVECRKEHDVSVLPCPDCWRLQKKLRWKEFFWDAVLVLVIVLFFFLIKGVIHNHQLIDALT